MNLKIAVLSGDGIGPEVTLQAKKALYAIGVVYNHEFVFEDAYIGAIAIEKTGKPLPEQTLICAETPIRFCLEPLETQNTTMIRLPKYVPN